MATIEQEQQQRATLQSVLETLASIDPAELVRADLGKGLDFSSGVIYFSRTLRLFRDLYEANLDTVPYARLVQLTQVAQQAKQQIDAIQQFSLEKYPQTPVASRDQLIATIRDQYDSAFDAVAPVIAYSVRKGTDFARLEDDAREAVARLAAVVSDHEQKIAATLAESSSIVEQVRRAAQEVGVAQHAIHFRQEAEANARSARAWLVATAVAGLLTLIYSVSALASFSGAVTELSLGDSLQLAVAKLILFTVLFFAVVWCGRAYRSHQHNYVVNRHRQNALSTFETFAKAAADAETKGAVLLQATQSIFVPQPSGFVTQESEPVSSPQQIFEIFRSMTGPHGR